jgi:hypothetical protein
MNQASQDILDYIVDNHLALHDISDEGISKVIDALFNFNDLLPKEQVLFNSIMAQAIDFEWIAQQLSNWEEEEELKRLDAQREPIQNLKQGEVIDVIDDNGKLKYVQAQTMPAPTGVALIEQEIAEKPDLAAIAFELSAIYTQTYIDIYNKLIEAEIPHDNATAATSTIFIQVFQKLR